jgi:hypothetical protein
MEDFAAYPETLPDWKLRADRRTAILKPDAAERITVRFLKLNSQPPECLQTVRQQSFPACLRYGGGHSVRNDHSETFGA